MIDPWEIVRLTDEQAAAAGAVIHRALAEEPIGHYMYPDPQERQRLLPRFTLWCREACLYGQVYTTAGEPHGVAFWNPPDTGEPPPPPKEQPDLPRARDIMGPDAHLRWGRVMDYMTQVNYATPPPPHWYLSILAVDPAYQRQGIGSALIQYALRQADATGVPCALDTTLPQNVGYFQRHGFQVAMENVEPESGIRLWRMWREPGASAA